MLDLVLDAATGVNEAIRRNPEQASRAQAQITPEHVWELTAGS
jgi:hypothetical protein